MLGGCHVGCMLAGNPLLAGTGVLISSWATDGGSAAYGLRISTLQGFLVESCIKHGNEATSKIITRAQQCKHKIPRLLMRDFAVVTLLTSLHFPIIAGEGC
jgi:hypothetical protein